MPRNTNLTKFGETRMVAEYIAETYPDADVFTRLRLGTLTPDGPRPNMSPEELAMQGVFRRWADAVVITPSELIVVEGSIRASTGKPSQLIIYGRLVPHTTELQPFLNRRLVLELVTVIEDPVVRTLAEEFGIRTRVYTPKWFPEYVASLHRRERRPVQARGLLSPPEGGS